MNESNTGFWVSAFLVVWALIWAYLVSLHKRQRNLEDRIDKMEQTD
jgi:CcmD family protein